MISASASSGWVAALQGRRVCFLVATAARRAGPVPAAVRARSSSRFLCCGLLLATMACGASVPSVTFAQGSSVTLSWVAPGDDGNVGTAAGYEVRMSTGPINGASWGLANVLTGVPVPQSAGTIQSMVVSGLSTDTTYYFALKARDEADNWSAMSNVVRWDWILDTTAPVAPIGLVATAQGGGTVRLTWAPNAEPDLAGYEVYRAPDSSGPFTRLNGSVVAGAQYLDATVPGGTGTLWYEVSAEDVSGNESARSAAASASFGGQATGWTMETGYPNPSARGETVTFPVVVAGAGGSAVLEIINGAGQRVRRMEVGTLAPGSTALHWDGRNDAGREVAPGTYTAWLISGSTKFAVRIVRVP
jgi:hypothetical protein